MSGELVFDLYPHLLAVEKVCFPCDTVQMSVGVL